MYVCIYIYIYNTYIHICLYVCICVCVYIYIYIHIVLVELVEELLEVGDLGVGEACHPPLQFDELLTAANLSIESLLYDILHCITL